ncbi:hypothetical protein HG536_0C05680 [Torulaspora globosa]|uniref:Signal peptidase complex subunit 2 n=1 Tax=Torulaspora globosa TaxID=48254 RepID=A0A7G3ZFW3_9SACH|nr:uncharacterized protein HG536_0C05680 [Torulaspora globosa]QLL32399.1 hypothetical protein HG536_0C05680 [Torulaspora globosa]
MVGYFAQLRLKSRRVSIECQLSGFGSMSKAINVYSIPELQQTLDEALPGTFARLQYKRSFRLIDTKLAVGYSIAAVAAVSFLLDKKFQFSEVLGYQQLLLAAYAVLSLAFWYFTRYVEKGVTYEGTKPDGEKITVKTRFANNEPVYLVQFVKEGGAELETRLAANKVFSEAGYLQTDLLFGWLKEQLETLGRKKLQ